MVTDGIDTYQSGDAFSVYPGDNSALESIRLLVFYDALQDLRALKLLEGFIGKENTVEFIESRAKMKIKFDEYPHSENFILNLRKDINSEIKNHNHQ